jgi:hypothetical protein
MQHDTGRQLHPHFLNSNHILNIMLVNILGRGSYESDTPAVIGRRLASALHRNSASPRGEPALASRRDASRPSSEEEEDTGPSDKWPVLLQHAGGGAFSTTSVLPEYGFLTQNLATQLERYPVGPLVSLCLPTKQSA